VQKRNNKWDHDAAQHDFMARYRHERLAKIIQRYDATNGNQYDIAYYKALAWEGLKDSRFYSIVVPINSNIDNYFLNSEHNCKWHQRV
jgi:hypothetical protein